MSDSRILRHVLGSSHGDSRTSGGTILGNFKTVTREGDGDGKMLGQEIRIGVFVSYWTVTKSIVIPYDDIISGVLRETGYFKKLYVFKGW